MDQHQKGSELFLGLVGVGAIGLLVALLLFSVLSINDTTELAFIDVNHPAQIIQDRN